jgi:hypothetical protein
MRGTGGTIFILDGYWNHPFYGRAGNPRSLEYDIVVMRTTTAMTGTNIQSIPISPLCDTNPCCQVCAPADVTVTGEKFIFKF